MLNIERALNNDLLLRSLTGLNRKVFEALLVDFDTAYQQTLWDKPRKQAVGGKHNCKHQGANYFSYYFISSVTPRLM